MFICKQIDRPIQVTGDAPHVITEEKWTLDINIYPEYRNSENALSVSSSMSHELYAKEVSGKLVIRSRSAMSSAMKRSVITPDLLTEY